LTKRIPNRIYINGGRSEKYKAETYYKKMGQFMGYAPLLGGAVNYGLP